jgi:hypothetical protein
MLSGTNARLKVYRGMTKSLTMTSVIGGRGRSRSLCNTVIYGRTRLTRLSNLKK